MDSDPIIRLIKRRQLLTFSSGLTASVWLATSLPARAAARDQSGSSCAATSARSLGIGQETELAPEDAILLKPGETLVVRSVNPRCFYYPTQLVLEPGAVYQFDSAGFWKDGFLRPCGPEGWPGLLLQAGNRLPGRQFFLLCGCVGKTDHTAFAIGKGRQWVAPHLDSGADHKLYLFANDWPQNIFQANNRELTGSQGGPLRVTIFRRS